MMSAIILNDYFYYILAFHRVFWAHSEIKVQKICEFLYCHLQKSLNKLLLVFFVWRKQ